MDSWVTLPENIFSLKFMVFRSGLACQAVMTGVEGIRVRGPGALASVVLLFLNVRPVVSTSLRGVPPVGERKSKTTPAEAIWSPETNKYQNNSTFLG
ncbi:MAG: hypothetical protein V8T44_13315 [Odoribacter splanchnicus]